MLDELAVSGLGLRDIDELCRISMTKRLGRLMKSEESIWARCMSERYIKGRPWNSIRSNISDGKE